MSLPRTDLDNIRRRLQMILTVTDVATIHHDAAMALATLEHLGADVEARVAALNELWKGKRVRTEDHTLPPSGNLSDRLEVGKPFGGEGEVVEFYEQGGKVWLRSDWGYEWVIEPTTVITELPDKTAGLASDSGEADSDRPTDCTEPQRHVSPAASPVDDE